MEKRGIGILLTFLGIAGLIIGAINFLDEGMSDYNVRQIVIYGFLGVVLFFSGVSIIHTSHDRTS